MSGRRRAWGEEAGANGGAVAQGTRGRRRKWDVESLGLQPSAVLNRELPLLGERYGGVVIIAVEGEDELAFIQAVPFPLCTSQLDHNPSWKMPLRPKGGGADRGEATNWAVLLLKRSATSTSFLPASSFPISSTLCHFLTSHRTAKAPKSQ